MGRWAPDARGRLVEAALELYGERGFDSCTVAEIATRAGLTERTFFRYFVDKREVLFWGAADLQDALVAGVDAAPPSVPPVDTVIGALVSVAGSIFEERRTFSQRRQAVIAANVELQERELIKLARLAGALAEALRRRGVAEPAAGLAAELGIGAFKISFERWVTAGEERTLATIIENSASELRALYRG